MTRDEAIAILQMPRDKAVAIILDLAARAEKHSQRCGDVSPTTPSGMTPTYLKPNHGRRKKKPGRKKGHPGAARKQPDKIDYYKEHTTDNCPHCQTPVGKNQ